MVPLYTTLSSHQRPSLLCGQIMVAWTVLRSIFPSPTAIPLTRRAPRGGCREGGGGSWGSCLFIIKILLIALRVICSPLSSPCLALVIGNPFYAAILLIPQGWLHKRGATVDKNWLQLGTNNWAQVAVRALDQSQQWANSDISGHTLGEYMYSPTVCFHVGKDDEAMDVQEQRWIEVP